MLLLDSSPDAVASSNHDCLSLTGGSAVGSLLISTPSFDDQSEIEHQLREETVPPEVSEEARSSPPRIGNLPPHLDPEWLALEVYADDDDESDSETEDEEDPDVKTIYGSTENQLLAGLLSPSAAFLMLSILPVSV